jgi:hypothetical protein
MLRAEARREKKLIGYQDNFAIIPTNPLARQDANVIENVISWHAWAAF